MQTEGFDKYAIELCKGSARVGHQEALTEVQKLYPEVKVKKKALDWDTYAIDKIDREYARLVEDEVPEFELIKHLKQRVAPLMIEELKMLTIDYKAAELDKQF